MSSSLSNPSAARRSRAVSVISLLTFSITLILVVALAGCGGGFWCDGRPLQCAMDDAERKFG